ncbi:hypothetical protein B0H12DRAFT_1094738 [Mycena haematopus]|nr:hypothetical protein B0H12DRAFT_1094738 [Mycena haematopus]
MQIRPDAQAPPEAALSGSVLKRVNYPDSSPSYTPDFGLMPSHIVAANLVEALLEVFFYGVYAVLFITVLYLFRRRHGIPPKSTPAVWVLLGLLVQFLAITGHFINTLYQTLFAIGYLGAGPAATEWYLDLARPSFVTNIALLVISHTVTDSIVLHRLYIIFPQGRNVMIFPLACFVGQAVSGIGLVSRAATLKPGEDFLTLENGWLTAKLIASILISTYSSVIIAHKVWRIRKALRGKVSQQISHGMQLTSLLAILVESAALQTATAIGMLVSFQCNWQEGEFIWTGIAASVFGVSTVLIHSRIGLGWAHDNSDQSISSKPLPTSRIQFPTVNRTDDEHTLETTESDYKSASARLQVRSPTRMYTVEV